MITHRDESGEVLVTVYDGPSRDCPVVAVDVPLGEVLPEADERDDALIALLQSGEYLGGGGASPVYLLTESPWVVVS